MDKAPIVDANANANDDAYGDGNGKTRAYCLRIQYAVDLPLPDVCNAIQMVYYYYYSQYLIHIELTYTTDKNENKAKHCF